MLKYYLAYLGEILGAFENFLDSLDRPRKSLMMLLSVIRTTPRRRRDTDELPF